ncbi:helix-turn-helix transcriptional regulator [Niallia endozanthoxylica]|uniref:Helix-turn-helix transcriptional regulator n=2 Tax=Niallia endozanthoxylica TaxID=2036016 RepID=A0A5J5I7M9_9BACI|nr:helix-turn-helix transcriptional regulator [Niallia endozanthoxylica]
MVHFPVKWGNSTYGMMTTCIQSELIYNDLNQLINVFIRLLSLKCYIQNGKHEKINSLRQLNKQKVEIDQADIEKISDLKEVIVTLDLTHREKDVLFLILEGLNNAEVADHLKISPHTVKNHVTNIFRKLNVSNRIQAMAKIYRIKYDMD